MKLQNISSLVIKRILGYLLIFSFFISPLTVVFAQEASEESLISSPTESSEVVEEIPILETTEEKSKEELKEEEQTMTMASESTSNFENLTAGLTKIGKNILKTDETTGALNYSYDIVTPPGRNGLQPDLKLNYNNQQADNYQNLIGYGWNINIPYIERINKTGTDKLYTEKYFYSSLSGELVNAGGSTYRAKVDNGEYLVYTLAGNIWSVKDKNGTVYSFGTNATER